MFSYIKKLKGKSEPPKTYYDRKRDTREGTGMAAGLSSRYLVLRPVDPAGKERAGGTAWSSSTGTHRWPRVKQTAGEPGRRPAATRGAGRRSRAGGSGARAARTPSADSHRSVAEANTA